MKIATILDHIDSGHMALPEFSEGTYRSRQVPGLLIHSLSTIKKLIWRQQYEWNRTRTHHSKQGD